MWYDINFAFLAALWNILICMTEALFPLPNPALAPLASHPLATAPLCAAQFACGRFLLPVTAGDSWLCAWLIGLDKTLSSFIRCCKREDYLFSEGRVTMSCVYAISSLPIYLPKDVQAICMAEIL